MIRSIGKSIFFSYLLTTFLPLLLINTYLIFHFSEDWKTMREEQISLELNAHRETLFMGINKMYNTMDILSSDLRIIDFLQFDGTLHKDFFLSYHEQTQGILSRFVVYNPMFSHVYLFTSHPNIIEFAPSFSIRRVLNGEALSALEKDTFLIETIPGKSSNLTLNREVDVFIQKILIPSESGRSEDSHAILAILNQEYFSSPFDSLRLPCRVVLERNSAMSDFRLVLRDDLESSRNGITQIRYPYKVPGYSDQWDLFITMEEMPAMAFYDTYLFFNISMFALILIITFLRNYLYSKDLTSRLSSLKIQADLVALGNYRTAPVAKRQDEIRELSLAMNSMATEINRLVEEGYKREISNQQIELQRQKAEFHALQSRINPHMFFNTLETIRMKAMEKGENETADMLNKFALLFRRSSLWEDDHIPLAKELKFVEYVMALHKFRFPGRITFNKSVPKTLLETPVPKFILQELVENALQHGIEKKGGGTVSLKCKREETNLRLIVRDDGMGIERRRLAEIKNQIEGCTINDKNVGLLNIAARLKVIYCGEARLSIMSEEKMGTEVTIDIPIDLVGPK